MDLMSEIDFLNIKPGDKVFDEENKPWEVLEMLHTTVRLKRQISRDGFMYFAPSIDRFGREYSLLQREKIKKCTNP